MGRGGEGRGFLEIWAIGREMFRGTFDQKIDEKGRINVPAKFRDVLRTSDDERLFITNFAVQDVRCLDAYPYSVWLQLEARLRERGDRSPEVIQFFQNYYFPGAQECQLDKQGRLLVPPRLREYAALAKDVIFTGALDKFRIWDRDAWQPVFAAGEQTVSSPGVVSELGM